MNASLFSAHVNYPHMNVVDKICEWKPRVIKTLDFSDGPIRRYYEMIPEVTMIGRLYTGDQSLGNTLEEAAQKGREFAEKILSEPVNSMYNGGNEPLIPIWESLNEPFPGYSDEFTHRKYDEYMYEFNQTMMSNGFSSVGFNFATGNFPWDKDYLDWYQQTFETYKYIGIHSYDDPHLFRLHDEGLAKPDDPEMWVGDVPHVGDGGSWLVGRERRWVPQVIERYGDKDVYCTELGLTQGVWGNQSQDVGYRYETDTTGQGIPRPISYDSYFDSLVRYHDFIKETPYIKGACLFVTGS